MGTAEPLNRLRQALADRYRIERELGRGGMATVYLAHDLRHDRPVALKVLEPDLAAALGPERFQREIRVAARLQHPHILTVYDSGEVAPDHEGPRLLWFTMPYVEGESLRDRLRREHQLSIDDAIRITREAASGLDYAHRHGIVHRDVKPENVLLTSDGDVLVADFGIARALGSADEALTQTGLAVGTPAYMSPEQAAGERELDPRTDVYSLGCVLYEMLAGEPPYTGPTAQAVLAKRFHEPIPSVRRGRPGVPETVDLAIQRALATVPADRFRTPAELAQALSSVSSSARTAVLAPPTTIATPTAGPSAAGRRRLPIGAATLALGFLLGLGVLFAWRKSHRGTEETGGAVRLVVLPFENMGDSAQGYFADGITDEIRTKLTGLQGVSVIARESADQYRRLHKPLQQLGEELGVQYVLQGTIRWEKTGDGPGRVRVSPELVRVSDGTNVWAQRYDAVLSQVFEVQAQIAEAVAAGLGVALSPHQQQELATRPTENLEAYDVYLRAGAVNTEAGFRESQALLERAVALDSNFAKAWAELANARLSGYWFGYDKSEKLLAAAKVAVDRALSLAPKDPDSYAALGYYHYWGHRDYTKALAAFQQALALSPAHNGSLYGVALVSRRLGHWDAAVQSLRRAVADNPRDVGIQAGLGETFFLMKRYQEALAELDKALSIDPANYFSWNYRAYIRLALTGDFAAARAEFARAPEEIRQRSLSNFQMVVVGPVGARLLSPESEDSLLRVPMSPLDADSATYYLARATGYQYLERPAVARAYFDSAAARLRRVVAQQPDDPEVHANLGVALAGLGQAEAGLQEARRAVELLPFDRDQLANAGLVLVQTRIEVLAGHHDEAVAHLRSLLAQPGLVSVGYLKASPEWAPLRSRADFQQLLGAAGT
jgi:serine/threonine-protein kinase